MKNGVMQGSHKFKSPDIFNREYLRHDLKNSSIRSGLNSMTAEVITFVLNLGVTIVLARILMPEHFGMVSMVVSLTSFAERFKDLGLSTATVQRKDLNHELVSMLFWFNVSIGLLFMLAVAALSPVIAWFYHDPRLINITLIISTNFLFGGLTIQHQALMRRQMRFGSLAQLRIITSFLSAIAGVSLALTGFGYWALIWKELVRGAFNALGTWLFCRWLPGMPTRGTGVKSLLRFGRDITAFDAIFFFSRTVDQILIGKIWGAGSLGIYTRAQQLMSIPLNQLQYPVQSVAESSLSTLQCDRERYRAYYSKIVSLMAFTTMPLVVYLGLFSENIILFLFGDKWIESASIFRMLAIAGFIQPVMSTAGFVMVTSGFTRRYLRWGVMNALGIIMAFGVGVLWGPKGVAAGFVIFTYIFLIPLLRYGFRYTPISPKLFFEAILLPAVTSILMGISLVILSHNVSLDSNLYLIAVTFPVAILFYFLIWMLMPGGRQKFIEYITYPLDALNMTPQFLKKLRKRTNI